MTTATTINDIKESNARGQRNFDELRAIIQRMNDSLRRLEGSVAEIKIRPRVRSIIRQRLNLDRPRILLGGDGAMEHLLDDLLDAAVAAQRITYDQRNRLLDADFIASATDRTKQPPEPVYLAVELSVTVDRHDIERAAEWAGILAQASENRTVALVLGGVIPPQAAAHAASQQVNIVQLADLNIPEDEN